MSAVASTPGARIATRRRDIPRYRSDQGALAEDVGVSRQQVSKWENDHAQPTGKNLRKLAEVLDVTPEWILEGDISWQDESGRRWVAEVKSTYPDKPPTPDPDGSPAEQLLYVLGMRAGMRRVAREMTSKDLITTAYSIARADGWPIAEFRKLDAFRDAIMEEEQKGGS